MNKGTCIHFTGLLGDDDAKCRAGVNYRTTFDGSKPGIFLRLPCIQYHICPAHGRGTYVKFGEPTVRKEFDRKDETMIPCSLYVEPTDEEVKKSQLETEARLEKIYAALKTSAAWRVKGKPSHDRKGVVECPVCKGKLHLSQSSYNGHVWGKCETEDCVAWME